jgi:hypothetical protein
VRAVPGRGARSAGDVRAVPAEGRLVRRDRRARQPAAALQFASEVGFTFPSGFDPDGRLAFDYELVGMPTTVVIDGAGLARYRFTGIVDAASLRRALDDVLTSA